MTDFISNTSGAALTAFWLFVAAYMLDWNFMGAMFALNMIGFGALAIGGCIIAGAIWLAKHVRITIV